jgi:hypothetical protein
MPNFEADDGDDVCACTFSQACPYHAEQQARRDAEYRADCEREGINPNASVEGLEEIVMAVELSPYLSDHQKRAIRRVMFPAVRP